MSRTDGDGPVHVFPCPECDGRIVAEGLHAGDVVTCVHCGAKIEIGKRKGDRRRGTSLLSDGAKGTLPKSDASLALRKTVVLIGFVIAGALLWVYRDEVGRYVDVLIKVAKEQRDWLLGRK